MSRATVARRELVAATHTLAHVSQPELGHFTDVTKALAAILSDELGFDCKIVLKCGAPALKKLLEKTQ